MGIFTLFPLSFCIKDLPLIKLINNCWLVWIPWTSESWQAATSTFERSASSLSWTGWIFPHTSNWTKCLSNSLAFQREQIRNLCALLLPPPPSSSVEPWETLPQRILNFLFTSDWDPSWPLTPQGRSFMDKQGEGLTQWKSNFYLWGVAGCDLGKKAVLFLEHSQTFLNQNLQGADSMCGFFPKVFISIH